MNGTGDGSVITWHRGARAGPGYTGEEMPINPLYSSDEYNAFKLKHPSRLADKLERQWDGFLKVRAQFEASNWDVGYDSAFASRIQITWMRPLDERTDTAWEDVITWLQCLNRVDLIKDIYERMLDIRGAFEEVFSKATKHFTKFSRRKIEAERPLTGGDVEKAILKAKVNKDWWRFKSCLNEDRFKYVEDRIYGVARHLRLINKYLANGKDQTDGAAERLDKENQRLEACYERAYCLVIKATSGKIPSKKKEWIDLLAKLKTNQGDELRKAFKKYPPDYNRLRNYVSHAHSYVTAQEKKRGKSMEKNYPETPEN